jgi:hypothetical protein
VDVEPLEDLRVLELAQPGVVQLGPRPRRGDRRVRPAAQEYGEIVVLLPLFWLQSKNTLPSRSERFIELMTRSG